MLSSQNNNRDDVTCYVSLTLNNCVVSSPCVVPSDCSQMHCAHANPPSIYYHPSPFCLQIKKVKAIYHTMNMFNLDYTQRCLVGECWCPVDSLDDIQAALTRGKVHVIDSGDPYDA